MTNGDGNKASGWRTQFQQVLGVELTLTPVSWDELDALMGRSATWPQIANTYWWSDVPDPHEWLSFWTCGDEIFADDIGYCNPEYDALVERSDRALDPEERVRLAQERSGSSWPMRRRSSRTPGTRSLW